MSVAAQVEYESQVRIKYAALAFFAALMLVGQQLLQLTGPHSSVDELTLDLIYANKRETLDLIASVLGMLGLISVGVVLNWLFVISRVRNPGMKPATRWMVIVGAVLSSVMLVAYTVVVASKAHTFVTTGVQSYPEANNLTKAGLVELLPLLLQVGTLLLTLGCIWTSLNMMRVGLVTRLVGYVGIVAGALFLFPIGALVPLIQGYWLAALAITLAARWPSGDPPAWARGEAIAWVSKMKLPPGPAEQRSRPSRAERRKISDQDVLAAVEPAHGNGGPSPSTSSGKRKRKRK